MAIGQVELNQAMTRIQDYTTQKHNEDQRGVLQQNQAQDKFNKELNQDIRKVLKGNQEEYQNRTEYQNKKFDARDKGSNQYTGDGGKHRKKGTKAENEGMNKGTSGFDIRI